MTQTIGPQAQICCPTHASKHNTANGFAFTFTGLELIALGSGALWWPSENLLCVSDLHLGKSTRFARTGGAALPPYQTQATLLKLQTDLETTGATTVVCLGDSFDDRRAVDELAEQDQVHITHLQAGRRWIWIEGNHDPGPLDIGGSHRTSLACKPLFFCHIAAPNRTGEISGHYHPKIQLKTVAGRVSRSCFLHDTARVILPAYGVYTGGLDIGHSIFQTLMEPHTLAILTGKMPRLVPMQR
ncbi:MAG: ligase-associated DNA damage response endonuclease PdeM [Paracoccaceae bacterium]|nr:ligase-associated DNA damage response endonuclease PdeM [Paracoccaceae bacterium]